MIVPAWPRYTALKLSEKYLLDLNFIRWTGEAEPNFETSEYLKATNMLSILRKARIKDKEMRILMLYV